MENMTFEEALAEVNKIANGAKFTIEYLGNWGYPDNIEITIETKDGLQVAEGTNFKEAIEEIKLNLN